MRFPVSALVALQVGVLAKNAALNMIQTESVEPTPGGALLLEDGTSGLMLEDGSSYILLEG